MKFLKLKILEDEWNGISLVDIAKEINFPLNNIADDRIYEEYYKRLKAKGYKLSDEWVDVKKKTSKFCTFIIEEYKKRTGCENPKILSVGAGLAIVEIPLIKNGYDLTLQECQPTSFDYLRNECLHTNIIISKDLQDVKSDLFDIIFCITSTYPLDDVTYLNLLKTMGVIETVTKKLKIPLNTNS